MADHPSARKRQRQSEKRRVKNRSVKSELKTFVKKVKKSATKDKALEFLNTAISKLAKAGQKGILHKKSASRQISRLTQAVNKMK